MDATVYPLRRPAAWERPHRFGRWSMVLGVALLLGGVALAGLVLSADRTSSAPLIALLSGGGLAAWGAIAIGASFAPKRASPELVNAVAVTPIPDRLPDDWVHLFRRARLHPAFAGGIIALGAYLIVLVGSVLSFVATGEESPGTLVLLVIPLAAGIATATLGVREALARRRSLSFGRAPTGFTVGPAGITLLDVGTTRSIPWHRLVRVSATNAPTRGGQSSLYPQVLLTISPDAPDQKPETVTLWLGRYRAAPHVVFTTLATAHEGTAFHDALGTARAQRLLEEWSALAP